MISKHHLCGKATKAYIARVAFLSLPNVVPMSFSQHAILDGQFQPDIVYSLIAHAGRVLANLETEIRDFVGNIELEQYWNNRVIPMLNAHAGRVPANLETEIREFVGNIVLEQHSYTR